MEGEGEDTAGEAGVEAGGGGIAGAEALVAEEAEQGVEDVVGGEGIGVALAGVQFCGGGAGDRKSVV